MNDYILSVCLLTYHHEKYIRQSVQSILEQKVDFIYEIVVGDDCSTDRTVEILEELKELSDININISKNEKNLGIPENLFKTMSRCLGKYIVLMAGDDYIIDERKFFKQVEFLENNTDFIAVTTPGELRYDFEEESVGNFPTKVQWGKEFSRNALGDLEVYSLNGVMFRNLMLTNEGRDLFSLIPKASKYIDDTTMNILLVSIGRLFTLESPMIVHRIFHNTKSEHNYTSVTDMTNHIEHKIELLNYLENHFDGSVDLYGKYYLIAKDLLLRGLLHFEIGKMYRIWMKIPKKHRKITMIIGCAKDLLFMTWNRVSFMGGQRSKDE